jgi:Asp-tRNA(Asn)/Glu-tRNA(Gln) amidotransferase A subunit family amidase
VTFPEYESFDALGLAELVRRRQISAGELLDAAIERIEARDGTIGAIVIRMYDEARQAIAAGLPDGPFTGVPFSLKDLVVFVKGVPTTSASRLFKDFVPDHDSTLVARYRRAGLVILAKTKTPELGLSVTTEPTLYGPAHNPWNPAYSPGGSSGGAAAAVAAGYMPMAHATDGGGSIRIPASFCGLFGLKPSRGRISAAPDFGEALAGMATSHCVSWSVRDSAALLDATAGAEPGDPYAAPPLPRPLLDEVGAPPGQLRIALCTTDFLGNPVDPECAAAARAAAALCETLGHRVEEARPDLAGLSPLEAWRVIPSTNLYVNATARTKALGRELQPGDLEPLNRAWMDAGGRYTAADYLRTISLMHALARRVGAFLENYDLILTPALGRPSLKLGVVETSGYDVDRHVSLLFEKIAPHTALFNQTGGAAMTVPFDRSGDGLPVGVQFAGRLGDEPKLIRLAAQIEEARPWFKTRPKVAGKA